MQESVIEVAIEGILRNGKGSGTFTDRDSSPREVEIPFCMPGDIVQTSIKNKKRGKFLGRLLKVLKNAPERIPPKCPHFGSCGGCSWQHMPYKQQLQVKQAIIAESFKDLLTENVTLHPIQSSPEAWEYRNKMEFSFSQDRQGNKYLGLYLEGGRGKVFNLYSCFLVSPWFSEVVIKVRQWWETSSLQAYHPISNRGTLRSLTLRETKTNRKKMVILTVSGHPDYAISRKQLDDFQRLFEDASISVYLRIHQSIKGQPTQVFEMHLQGPESISETLSIRLKSPPRFHQAMFNLSPASFFQPNTLQAERIYIAALQMAELTESDVVYDLFCGAGTIGLLAGSFVKSVLGIELSPEASLDGRTNIALNGIKNVSIVTGSVTDVLKQKHNYPKPTVVIVDPPRAGLDAKAIKEILALESPKLIYISCNPETQVRDIKELIAAKYALLQVQPIDQFPHTPHIENIVQLKREF